MIDFILRYWLECIFGLIITALGIAYKRIAGKLKEQELMREGILAILHDRLYQACRCYIQEESIDVSSLKNIEYLYTSYHDLGGNGTGTELYNRVKSLPIKED